MIMLRNFGLVHEDYIHLDPRTFADADELMDMYVAIKYDDKQPPATDEMVYLK